MSIILRPESPSATYLYHSHSTRENLVTGLPSTTKGEGKYDLAPCPGKKRDGFGRVTGRISHTKHSKSPTIFHTLLDFLPR